MRLYIASSWKNPHQPDTVSSLRAAGFDVYDFRNPGANEVGFSWEQIAEDWRDWSVPAFRDALLHPISEHAFARDHAALEWCDACVLLLPCGKSAHLEAGWCAGRGKQVVVYAPSYQDPELMYKFFDTNGRTPLCEHLEDVVLLLGQHTAKKK